MRTAVEDAHDRFGLRQGWEVGVQERLRGLALDQPLEIAFANVEASALRIQAAIRSLTGDLRKFTAAAEKGNLSALGRAKEALRARMTELFEATKAVFDTDLESLAREIGSPQYLEEVVREASKINLHDVRIARNAILSYPHRAAFHSATTYRLGYRSDTDLRPSVVAKALKEEREKATAIAPSYLESLRSAYLLLGKGASGISVALSDVYNVLTMLPGAKKAYSEAEFVRDIGVLDEVGPKITKDGFRVSFPASTSARLNKGYTGVNSKGHEVPYASVRFDAETKAG